MRRREGGGGGKQDGAYVAGSVSRCERQCDEELWMLQRKDQGRLFYLIGLTSPLSGEEKITRHDMT